MVDDSKKFPKVAIVGSRGFSNRYLVDRLVYLLPKEWTIVTGGARGVDTWAEETAKHHLRHVRIHKADWKKFGRAAGFVRNNQIVRDCDIVIAYWDGVSKGTRHTIQLTKSLKKPCIIVRLKRD